MKTKLVALGALALVAAAGLAVADPAEYVQPNAGVGVSVSITACAPAGVQGTSVNVGGGRFCPGHIAADANGQATITIADDVITPSSGTYCQDLNGNSICGERDPNDPVAGPRIEPRLTFCGTALLEQPIDLTPRNQWTTNNWDPGFAVLIFNHAPGTGNPTNSPCGMTYSGATHGFIHHS